MELFYTLSKFICQKEKLIEKNTSNNSIIYYDYNLL